MYALSRLSFGGKRVTVNRTSRYGLLDLLRYNWSNNKRLREVKKFQSHSILWQLRIGVIYEKIILDRGINWKLEIVFLRKVQSGCQSYHVQESVLKQGLHSLDHQSSPTSGESFARTKLYAYCYIRFHSTFL